MRHIKTFIFVGLITLLLNSAVFAQQTGSLTGQVVDTLGAIVTGATVTAVDATGKEKTATSNNQGEFTISGLAPGTYIVRVTAPNFSLYENTEVVIAAGQREELTVALSIEGVTEEVEVSSGNQVSTDPESNLSATVLKEQDLEALPDDPEELEAALQALAGASAGPNGGQIYIDGFEGGRIPPKEAIREIRINQNPFSAEFDRLGFGRIEILTKPGSDKFRGQAYFNFNDESLNSRNPFSANRASTQTRFYGGNVSGPIIKNKASFFFDVSNRSIDNAAVINALVLDPALNIVSFAQELSVPSRRFSISPRFDYQINEKNTLIARYSFTRFSSENQGIGNFSLPSRAFETNRTEHDFQITETMIINPKTINETRFEYEIENNEQVGDNAIPTVNVASAFTAGGSQVGLSFDRERDWELQNYTTTSLGKNNQHAVKFGVRLRGVNLTDRSESNYGGIFTFAGFAAAGDPCDIDQNNFVTSIEQYRCRVLGNTAPRYNPSQFIITTGNPEASVSRFDVGAFITDDWRVNQKLTLSFGLRYENQTNIKDNLNFAPRFGFAFSPGAGGARPPKTVFRGGLGIFYDRFDENLTLQAERLNGISQQQYIITDPAILSQVVFSPEGIATNVPTAAQLATIAPLSNTIRLVSPELQAPYTIQGALGVERQLPLKINLSAFYVWSRSLHQLRSRNINAPICPPGTVCPTDEAALRLLRPDPLSGNIYQYESSGTLNQQQFIVNFRTFFSPNLSLFGNYRLGFSEGDTDGAGSFPAYSYNLAGEFGRSSLDIRHNFFFGGSIGVPFGIRINPFIIARSGAPFNITRGVDINGDSLFNERPTYAQLSLACAQRGLTNDFCDTGDVADPNAVIPRNYGRGPGFLSVNLNITKNFGFGSAPERVAANAQGNQGGTSSNLGGGRRGGGGGRRGGGGGGGGGFFGGGESPKPYNLNVGLRITNLFNTVNEGNPVGSISSPFFGQPTGISGGFGFGGFGGNAGNRRVDLQMRFSW